jgi:hypothetical protein
MTPHQQGRDAAKAGKPRTANPFPKPLEPDNGPDYPGNWHDWDAGWVTGAAQVDRDVQIRKEATCGKS